MSSDQVQQIGTVRPSRTIRWNQARPNDWDEIYAQVDNMENPLQSLSFVVPRTAEELSWKRRGLAQLNNRNSVFSNGLADYAHTLLLGWYGQLDKQQSITISPNVLHSSQVDRVTDIVVSRHEIDGIWITGRQQFAADALFVNQLLLFIRDQGEQTATTLAILTADNEHIRYEVDQDLTSGVVAYFEEAFIPNDNVLIDRDLAEIRQLLTASAGKWLADYQWISRQLDVLELWIGTAFGLAESTGLKSELHIQGELGELIQSLDTLTALLHAAEIEASLDELGILIPAKLPLAAAKQAAGRYFKQVADILEDIAGEEILRNPNTFASTPLDKHDSLSVEQLTWKLLYGEGAIKQRLYEQYAFGDRITLASDWFRLYPIAKLKEKYEYFWTEFAQVKSKYEYRGGSYGVENISP